MEQDTTMNQSTTYKKIEPTLEISNVKYDNSFRMNKGTLAQLIVSLKDMGDRLELRSDNNVQKKLYPVIKEICSEVYNKYVELCGTVKEENLNEHAYFLMGPYMNGTFKFPLSSKFERKQYKYAEVGPTLKSVLNRIFHAKREVTNRLTKDKYEDKKSSYVELNNFLEMLEVHIKELSEKWKNSVFKIRKEENVVHSS